MADHKVDPNEFPKNVIVDGVTLVARNQEHEDALKAGKGDPQIAEAEQARLDADAAAKQKLADEAVLKAKEAKEAAAQKPALKTEPEPKKKGR